MRETRFLSAMVSVLLTTIVATSASAVTSKLLWSVKWASSSELVSFAPVEE